MWTKSILPIALATSVLASPAPVENRAHGAKINVVFYSDTACANPIQTTIYSRNDPVDKSCYRTPGQAFSSLRIVSIDDQYIGKNAALQVGFDDDNNETCNFKYALKYSISNRDYVGQCLFVGIPSGQGKPTRPGNEYRLTTLQG